MMRMLCHSVRLMAVIAVRRQGAGSLQLLLEQPQPVRLLFCLLQQDKFHEEEETQPLADPF